MSRKEPSGAEKKRAKLKREFMANLIVSTPEDPEVQKKKNESVYISLLFKKMKLKLHSHHQGLYLTKYYFFSVCSGLL